MFLLLYFVLLFFHFVAEMRLSLMLSGQNGNTALMVAVKEGHVDVVKLLLLQDSIDVNVENNVRLSIKNIMLILLFYLK